MRSGATPAPSQGKLTLVARPKKDPPPGIDELKELLRGSGLRATRPRIAVLQCLHDATVPKSHGDLVEELAREGYDRATIYRNLTDLAESGIVARTDLGDHVWRFSLEKSASGARHEGHHPHFVCSDCGTIACLSGISLAVKGDVTSVPKSVGKLAVEVQLRGLCDTCAS